MEHTWYSYLHKDGTIHTKRYTDWESLLEAGDSDFVKFCTRIYEARDREAAVRKGTSIIKHYTMS